MADTLGRNRGIEALGKNRALMIGIGVVVLVFIGLAAYVVGKRNAVSEPPRVQQAQQGPRITRLPAQHYGSWTLQCVRNPQGRTACGLGMRVTNAQRRGLILLLNVMRTRKGPAFRAVTPPNALLPAGFTITPDKGQKLTVPFSVCSARFCESIFLASDQLVSGLKQSDRAQIRFVAANGRAFQFQIPVNGFGAGYLAWQNTEPPMPAIDASAPKPGTASATTPKSAPAAAKPVENLNLGSTPGGN